MSGIGSGLGGSVGLAAEASYGTWAAPMRWVEVRNFKMQEQVHTTQGTGLANGRTVDLGSRRVVTYKDAKGTAQLEWLNTGMALLLKNIMGSNATLAAIGSTSAYQMTCNLGVPDNQNYLSAQSLVPSAQGTITPENFHGCKITKATWSIDMTNPLLLDLEIDSQTKDETQVAGTPTYVSNSRGFTFNGMSFKVGAFGSEATIDGVKKISLSVERTLKVDRIYMGNSTKFEPVTVGVTKITGSVDVDLTDTNKPLLWDIYHSQTAVPSIVAQFVGNAIGSSGKSDTLTLNPTNVFIDTGGTPELDGPDEVTATMNFTGLIDGSNDAAMIASVITADSTL